MFVYQRGLYFGGEDAYHKNDLSEEMDLSQEHKELKFTEEKWEENQNFIFTLQRSTVEEIMRFLDMYHQFKRGVGQNHICIL